MDFFDSSEYIKLDDPQNKVIISPPQIEMADIDMLGFVLNEVDNSRTAYYSKYKYKYKYYGGKGYGYGYGYGSRPKTEESSEPDGESDA